VRTAKLHVFPIVTGCVAVFFLNFFLLVTAASLPKIIGLFEGRVSLHVSRRCDSKEQYTPMFWLGAGLPENHRPSI